jgi:hypothetical protein
MIPHSSIISCFVPGPAPDQGRVPSGFAAKAKLKIWWRTGFPIVLGIAPPKTLGAVEGIGDLDGLFLGNTIWIDKSVFSVPQGPETAAWVIAHEILHAKIAIIRMQQHSPLGRYRYRILSKAAADALDLACDHPDLTDLAEILRKYAKSGFDENEEALVRIVQMIMEGCDLPQSPALKKAARLLARPWGINPAYLLRIALSLPICIWTARYPFRL